MTASCNRFKCFYEGATRMPTKGLSFLKPWTQIFTPQYTPFCHISHFSKIPFLQGPQFPPVPPAILLNILTPVYPPPFFPPVFSFWSYRPSQGLPPTQCAFAQPICWRVAVRHLHPISSPGSACLAGPWLFSFG